MINIPPVGSTIQVTFPTKPYDQRYVMKVIADDIENDSFGTIKLQILEDKETKVRQEQKWEFYEIPRYPRLYGTWNSEMVTKIRNFYNEDRSPMMVEKIEVNSKPCVDRFSIVEELWFDEELTGRKIEIL